MVYNGHDGNTENNAVQWEQNGNDLNNMGDLSTTGTSWEFDEIYYVISQFVPASCMKQRILILSS